MKRYLRTAALAVVFVGGVLIICAAAGYLHSERYPSWGAWYDGVVTRATMYPVPSAGACGSGTWAQMRNCPRMTGDPADPYAFKRIHRQSDFALAHNPLDMPAEFGLAVFGLFLCYCGGRAFMGTYRDDAPLATRARRRIVYTKRPAATERERIAA